MSFRGAGVLPGLLGLAELYYRRIAESGVVWKSEYSVFRRPFDYLSQLRNRF